MENTTSKTAITIGTTVQAPIEKVWSCWTEPQHIMQWNNASDDWHTPQAENDLRVGGTFLSRMEAKDGSMGFDFNGTYTDVQEHERIAYTLGDGRKVAITFVSQGDETLITETFDADSSHSAEMQQAGWQAILDNFKKHVEASPAKAVTLHYTCNIQAPADKVYQIMLDQEHYKTWTSAFHPTSHYKGSWEKGATLHFLGTDENGSEGGMVSRIKENIPNEFISIEHIGLVQNGEEITSGPEVVDWAGALENYTFSETNGETLLTIDVDTNQEFEAHFADTWPKALQKLKELCETES